MMSLLRLGTAKTIGWSGNFGPCSTALVSSHPFSVGTYYSTDAFQKRKHIASPVDFTAYSRAFNTTNSKVSMGYNGHSRFFNTTNAKLISPIRVTNSKLKLPVVFKGHSRSFSTTNTKFILSKYMKLYRNLVKKNANEYKISDGVGDDYKLVYQASSVNYVGGTMLTMEFIVSSLALVGAAATAGLCEYPFPKNTSDACVYFGFIAAVSYITLRTVKIYPIRIYYSEDKDDFEFVFLGYRPLSTRQLNVQPGQLKEKPPTFLSENVLQILDEISTIPGKQDILVVSCNFSSPFYYNKLFGY